MMMKIELILIDLSKFLKVRGHCLARLLQSIALGNLGIIYPEGIFFNR
jgi:hypothetical protein